MPLLAVSGSPCTAAVAAASGAGESGAVPVDDEVPGTEGDDAESDDRLTLYRLLRKPSAACGSATEAWRSRVSAGGAPCDSAPYPPAPAAAASSPLTAAERRLDDPARLALVVVQRHVDERARGRARVEPEALAPHGLGQARRAVAPDVGRVGRRGAEGGREEGRAAPVGFRAVARGGSRRGRRGVRGSGRFWVGREGEGALGGGREGRRGELRDRVVALVAVVLVLEGDIVRRRRGVRLELVRRRGDARREAVGLAAVEAGRRRRSRGDRAGARGGAAVRGGRARRGAVGSGGGVARKGRGLGALKVVGGRGGGGVAVVVVLLACAVQGDRLVAVLLEPLAALRCWTLALVDVGVVLAIVRVGREVAAVVVALVRRGRGRRLCGRGEGVFERVAVVVVVAVGARGRVARRRGWTRRGRPGL